MTMSAGQCTVEPRTGLAGAIFDAMEARESDLGMLPDVFTEGTDNRAALAAFVETIAQGVYSYLTTEGRAKLTISTSTGGLQTVGSVDTDPPATTKLLYATIE